MVNGKSDEYLSAGYLFTASQTGTPGCTDVLEVDENDGDSSWCFIV